MCELDLKKEARPLLTSGMRPRAFLEAFVAKKQFIAGIDFLWHAFAPRDAIWWGCLCCSMPWGIAFPMRIRRRARRRCVGLAPTEENRAAARAPADAAGPASAAGGFASAAPFTGGSIAPPKAPPVAPGPFAPAKAVAGAVKLASTKADPVRIAETQRLFLGLGVGIAEGRFSHADLRGMSAIGG